MTQREACSWRRGQRVWQSRGRCKDVEEYGRWSEWTLYHVSCIMYSSRQGGRWRSG